MPTQKRSAITGLSQNRLSQIRGLAKYEGPTGRLFFEEVVWWWRPMRAILGKNTRLIKVPPRNKRGFFPKYVFENLQLAESATGLDDLYRTWLVHELAARLDLPDGWIWPGYLFGEPRDRATMGRYGKTHLAKFPGHVDLRKTDKELVAEYRRLLPKLREKREALVPWPPNFEVTKTTRLSDRTFALIELIDRKFSLRETIPEGQWANVNRAVRRYFTAKA